MHRMNMRRDFDRAIETRRAHYQAMVYGNHSETEVMVEEQEPNRTGNQPARGSRR